MKKGICLGGLPTDLSLEEKLRLAKDAGFDGVEVGSDPSMANARTLRKLADSIGVELHSIMGGTHWQFPLTSPKKTDRDKTLRAMRKSLQQARIIGANAILLVPGVVNEQVTHEQAYDRALAAVRELAEDAEKAEVRILVENVWNKFLLSPTEFKAFIEEVGSDYVGAYFDVGNILIYGYPQHWIRSLGALIGKIHLKDFVVSTRTFTYLLQGDVDWKAVRRALLDVGYDDYLTVELGPYRSYGDQMVYDMSAAVDRIIAGE